jgi:hypothetical protein
MVVEMIVEALLAWSRVVRTGGKSLDFFDRLKAKSPDISHRE